MFDSFKNFIAKAVSKIFNKSRIQEKLKLDVAVSDKMARSIELWCDMYEGRPYHPKKHTKTMDLPASIASELARLVTLEFESSVTGNDFLNEHYQQMLKRLRIYTEYACAKGGIVFKPYVDGDVIEVDCVQADRFYPVQFNGRGEITAAAFVEYKQSGKDMYTRVEYHELSTQTYCIRNTAYLKKNYTMASDDTFGDQIPLSEVDEWAALEEEVFIKDIKKPLFSYFKMPLANNIDDRSPLGMSVYSRAVEDIKEADRQYDRILWEYEGSELALDVEEGAFKRDEQGNDIIPHGKERLFRLFDFESSEGTKGWNVFSPTIRDQSLFNGLNNLLRKIEFKCGLAYGTLSDVQDVDKTAEEIKASKQRSYSTVKDIQNSLQTALEDLIEAMDTLSKLYRLSNSKYEVSFSWDDSLIMNKGEELASMLADVSANILRPEIYLAKKYGVSEEEALKMMPSYEDSIMSPYNGLEE